MTRATLSLGGLPLANTDASTSELWWDRTDPDLRMILAPETARRARDTVVQDLDWLRAAGFQAVDVAWMYAGHAVITATKGHDS